MTGAGRRPRRGSAPPSASCIDGVIVAAFGRHYEVLSPAGRLHCYPRGKRSQYACGDQVRLQPGGDNQGVIEKLLPRRNLLWRSDAFRQKLIAANLSHVFIVVATEPAFSDLFVSRCLCAAESEQLKAVIILNKTDLASRLELARGQLAPFRKLGYDVLELSALQGAAPLTEIARNRQGILVGQSGMGKSTLINALLPAAKAVTGAISSVLDAGRHTTTFARLYALAAEADDLGAGWLIDSPGMQVFGLAHLDEEALAASFIEFRPHLGQCRFRDCRHQAEPGCALLEALAEGHIHPRRFEHFRSIQAEIEEARRLNPGW